MLEENKMLHEEDKEQEPEAQVKLEQEVNVKVPFPFDLNKLCMFSFDTLKDSIEFLARQQAEMNDRIGVLENKETEYVPITVVEKGAPRP